MEDKPDKNFISEDRKKMNSFYTFKMDESKLEQIKQRSSKQVGRFVITGLLFGFFTEWLLGNSTIYDNIVKKSTMRRLSSSSSMQRPRRKKK